jgi:hypothetical protein
MPRLVRSLTLVSALLLGACAAGATAPSDASGPTAQRAPAPSTVPREYLVTLAPDVDPALIREKFGSYGIDRLEQVGRRPVFLVAFARDPGLEALEKVRAGEPRIVAVQPNFVYRTQ